MMPKYCASLEARIQEAVLAYQQKSEPNISSIAREFQVPYQRLRHRLQGIKAQKGLPGQHHKLSDAQETALCRYIDRLDRINLSIQNELVRDAANHILSETTLPGKTPPVVGINWVTRFLRRHNYSKVYRKTQDLER